MSEHLDLLEYRRLVAGFYAEARASEPTEATWMTWRRRRDHLFATHPQSPIEDRSQFRSLPYFDYDPKWRLEGELVAHEEAAIAVEHSGIGSTDFSRVGSVAFEVDGTRASLTVLWLEAYGGGLFLPFRDTTNGTTTYGGGRYLLDTVKGADLGHSRNRVVLDFNYAYHPSCVHSVRWSCPLSPPENRLGFAIEAGERLPDT